MCEIFISYRRGDNYAEIIRNFLDKKLYPGVAFQDVYDLDAGAVQDRILENVRSSKVVILVIGKVFELRADQLNRQNDYVGQEIRAAAEARVPILPILIADRDINEIGIPAELSSILGIQNRLYLRANTIEQLESQLPQILPKVLPHLPGYWRRQANLWYRRFAAAALASIAAMLLWVLEIYTGVVWKSTGVVGNSIEGFFGRSDIAGTLENGRLPLTSLEYGDNFIQDLPPDLDKTPPGERARNWMDGWIQDLNTGVTAKGGGCDHCRLVVATYDFKQSYRSFNVRLTIDRTRLTADKRYMISGLYAFLVSDNGGHSVYHPVYRQLPAEYLPPTAPDVKPVSDIEPNAGEKLRLFVVVCKNAPAARWPDVPEDLSLSLEVR
jgi:TIR domain